MWETRVQLLLPQRCERKLPVRFTATALLLSVLEERSQASWPWPIK